MDLNKLFSKIKNNKAQESLSDEPDAEKNSETGHSKVDNKPKKNVLKQNLGDELLWTSGFVIAVLCSLLFGYLLKFNFFE